MMAVIVAAIAGIGLGSLWYGPLFGKQWMKIMGISKGKMDAAMKQKMMMSYFLTFIASIIMIYVLAHSMIFAAVYTNSSGASAAFMSAFWNWLGFIVPVTLGAVLWDGKPWKLFAINGGYWLAQLLLASMILSYWM
jgi:hypothetical protein